MQKFKRMALLAFVLSFILSLSLSAAAANVVVDRSQVGSISVTMKCGTVAVGGGELSIYRVGDIVYDHSAGGYVFRATEAYAGAGLDFSDVTDKTLAKSLANVISTNAIAPYAKQTVSAEGKATFEELELGLWLVMQSVNATGYLPAEPFLVSVPYYQYGAYDYDVDASPKVQLTAVTPTPTPTGGIPQTGQVNWLVPVLAVAGLTLFTIGWVLRYGKRDEA